MALAKHRRGRDIALLGLLDRQPHRPLVDDIAKPPMAVDDGRRRQFLDDDPGRAGHDVTDLDALDIGRDLDHPVRIVADQIGADDVAHDERGLLGGRARREEQRATDLFEAFCGNFRHGPILTVRRDRRYSGAARPGNARGFAVAPRFV